MRRLTSSHSDQRRVAEAALSRRLDPEACSPIAVALSGGGDSVALLTMVQSWALQRGRRVLALTVDHGLHPDSASWTRFAGDLAQRAGADWRALRWVGDKPAAGLPAAARAARQALLATAAREAGAEVIVFGHTASDVAEAEVMRVQDAPRLGRLYEWSPSPAWPEGRGLFALRPLLHWGREALRSWLGEVGAEWLDDPGNEDQRFARARARRLLKVDSRLGSKGEDLQAPANPEAIAEIESTGEGSLRVPAGLLTSPDASALRLMSVAALCASGARTPPRGRPLARLLSLARSKDHFTASLAGARITGITGGVEFNREPGEYRRRALPPSLLRAGTTSVWDGRFELTVSDHIAIAPLAGRAAGLSPLDHRRLKEIPPQRRSALPVILRHGEVFLPEPWGRGPAVARSLCAARLAAACGLIAHERDISRIFLADGP